MGYFYSVKQWTPITIVSIGLIGMMPFFDNLILAKTFCPPLKAPKDTNLTCELPRDQEKIDCSSSWLPNGTIAKFQCFNENGGIRKGRIKCNGDSTIGEILLNPNIPRTPALPCNLYADTFAHQINFYGYKKSEHYPMLPTTVNADFKQIGLSLHNIFRQRHHSNPLELDEMLNQKAQKWADHLLQQGTLDMASEPTLGQNVFSSETINKSRAINDAVQHWYYDGLANYNWTNVKSNWGDPLALEFSQLVWKSARTIGIGVASRDSNSEGSPAASKIVVLYFPIGNVVLEDSQRPEKLFVDNVLSP